MQSSLRRFIDSLSKKATKAKASFGRLAPKAIEGFQRYAESTPAGMAVAGLRDAARERSFEPILQANRKLGSMAKEGLHNAVFTHDKETNKITGMGPAFGVLGTDSIKTVGGGSLDYKPSEKIQKLGQELQDEWDDLVNNGEVGDWLNKNILRHKVPDSIVNQAADELINGYDDLVSNGELLEQLDTWMQAAKGVPQSRVLPATTPPKGAKSFSPGTLKLADNIIDQYHDGIIPGNWAEYAADQFGKRGFSGKELDDILRYIAVALAE